MGNDKMKMETYQGPVNEVLCANSIKEVKGIENIKIFKTKETARGKLHIAQCCKAMIAVNHPGPGPHCVPFQGGACNVKCDGAVIGVEACDYRIFEADWDPKSDPYTLPLPAF